MPLRTWRTRTGVSPSDRPRALARPFRGIARSAARVTRRGYREAGRHRARCRPHRAADGPARLGWSVPRTAARPAATVVRHGSARVGTMLLAAATAVVAAMVVGCLPPPQATRTRPGPPASAARRSPAATIADAQGARPGDRRVHEASVDREADLRVAFKGTCGSSTTRCRSAGSMDVSGADFASSFTYDWSREYAGPRQDAGPGPGRRDARAGSSAEAAPGGRSRATGSRIRTCHSRPSPRPAT